MAKKSSAKKTTKTNILKCGLTMAQLKKLSGILIDTTFNVYVQTRIHFQVETDDKVFEDLLEHFKMFRCAECNTWLSTSALCKGFEDICEECIDRIDASM